MSRASVLILLLVLHNSAALDSFAKPTHPFLIPADEMGKIEKIVFWSLVLDLFGKSALAHSPNVILLDVFGSFHNTTPSLPSNY